MRQSSAVVCQGYYSWLLVHFKQVLGALSIDRNPSLIAEFACQRCWRFSKTTFFGNRPGFREFCVKVQRLSFWDITFCAHYFLNCCWYSQYQPKSKFNSGIRMPVMWAIQHKSVFPESVQDFVNYASKFSGCLSGILQLVVSTF